MMRLKPQQTFPMDALIQRRRTFFLWTAGLSAAVLISIVLAVCYGTVRIPPEEALRVLLYKILQADISEVAGQVSRAHMDIIWEIRFPRVLMAVIAGAGLAMCGTIMQAAVQNPLADPYILGISAGASLGATFAVLIGAGGIFAGLGTAFWAFCGALGACLLVMALSGIGGQMSTVKMILAGTIANALFSAFTNFIIYTAGNAEGIRSVAFWTMGSLAAAKWSNLLLPALGVILCGSLFLCQSRILNTLLLGEEAAITLGVNLPRVRRNYMLATALITGLIVSACGVIGFVGLIIPHIVRGLVGTDHRRLLPFTILAGALFVTWADVLTRIILESGELPIGIITALLGAPVFMYILFKNTLGFSSK